MDCVRKPLWPGRRGCSYSPEARFTRSIFRLIKSISQIWEFSTLRCDFVCVCQDDRKRWERRGCFRFERRGMLSQDIGVKYSVRYCTSVPAWIVNVKGGISVRNLAKICRKGPFETLLFLSVLSLRITLTSSVVLSTGGSQPSFPKVVTTFSQSCLKVVPKLWDIVKFSRAICTSQ